MKIGFLAKNGKSNDNNIRSLKISSRNLANYQKSCFQQRRSNEEIESYQEHRRLTCKIIKSVILRKIKPVNQSLKMQNKWSSSVKEGLLTHIS